MKIKIKITCDCGRKIKLNDSDFEEMRLYDIKYKKGFEIECEYGFYTVKCKCGKKDSII